MPSLMNMMLPEIVRHRPSNKDGKRQGFALILTLWSLGLISLIAMAIIVGERYRVLSTAHMLENAKAQALAEAGVNLAREALENPSKTSLSTHPDAQPFLCTISQRGSLAMAVYNEVGKVDLNTASPELIEALLEGEGVNRDESQHLATAIFQFGHRPANEIIDQSEALAYRNERRLYGPKRAPYETIFELDQVLGMRPDLLKRLLPFVTVYSHLPGIDPRFASRELLSILGRGATATMDRFSLAARLPSSFLSHHNRSVFLIHAEARTLSGGEFSQEVIVERLGNGSPDLIYEWRHGDDRFRERLANAHGPPC